MNFRGWPTTSILCALVFAPACGDDGGTNGSTSGASTTSTPTSTSSVETSAGPVGATTDPTSTTAMTTATSGSTGADSTGAGSATDSTGGDSTGAMAKCQGAFAAAWIDGTNCGTEDAIQIHQYDDDTVILRQSLCTNFEAPFIYLLFGDDQVLMLDTGAGGIPVAATVQQIVDQWLAANGRASIEILVTNSHGHGDHTAGNAQMAAVPGATVVGTSQSAVASYFGIVDWPMQIVTHDLGGRLVDVIPIPGHQTAHVALYDHATGWLLTGDTLYPGRLYISDFPTYVQSINRLVDHTADLEVCHVLGTHIEMTNTPGQDFPFAAPTHPDEHPLELTRDHLVELRDAVEAMGNNPVLQAHDDFIVYPL